MRRSSIITIIILILVIIGLTVALVVTNLPQGNEQEDDDLYDLQKELEAKFDELFGPLE